MHVSICVCHRFMLFSIVFFLTCLLWSTKCYLSWGKSKKISVENLDIFVIFNLTWKRKIFIWDKLLGTILSSMPVALLQLERRSLSLGFKKSSLIDTASENCFKISDRFAFFCLCRWSRSWKKPWRENLFMRRAAALRHFVVSR